MAIAKAASSAHVALLRGINVGGKNKLPMADLRALFEALGCRSVATYIQSGNVVFAARAAVAKGLAARAAAALADRFGLKVPVVLRSAAELRDASRGNPFADDGDSLHVGFLADAPDPARLARLDPDRGKPDVFRVVGREVYLRFPGGVARSKLTAAYFDATLGTTITMRNWRTVTALVEMVERMGGHWRSGVSER